MKERPFPSTSHSGNGRGVARINCMQNPPRKPPGVPNAVLARCIRQNHVQVVWSKVNAYGTHSRQTHNKKRFAFIAVSGTETANAFGPSLTQQNESANAIKAISTQIGPDAISFRNGSGALPLTQSHPCESPAKPCGSGSKESADRQQVGRSLTKSPPAARVLQHETISPT